MKKFRKLLYITFAVFFTTCFFYEVNAQDIGCINYKKIERGYTYATNVYKQIDSKVLDLQKFLIQKEGEYKSIDSPIKRKNFEESTQKEYKAKEDAVLKFKIAKEDEIYNNIVLATKAVAKEKKLNTVLNYNVIIVGGIDITDEVIKYLNSHNPKSK